MGLKPNHKKFQKSKLTHVEETAIGKTLHVLKKNRLRLGPGLYYYLIILGNCDV
jgi:hypothetical protein